MGRAAGSHVRRATARQIAERLTRSDLVDRIRGLLGGRAAEEIIFGEVTTGAENDLEHATALARQLKRESLDEQTFNALPWRQAPAPAIDPSHGSSEFEHWSTRARSIFSFGKNLT